MTKYSHLAVSVGWALGSGATKDDSTRETKQATSKFDPSFRMSTQHRVPYQIV